MLKPTDLTRHITPVTHWLRTLRDQYFNNNSAPIPRNKAAPLVFPDNPDFCIEGYVVVSLKAEYDGNYASGRLYLTSTHPRTQQTRVLSYTTAVNFFDDALDVVRDILNTEGEIPELALYVKGRVNLLKAFHRAANPTLHCTQAQRVNKPVVIVH